jgi:anaerobic magnesium-protoporphyrin IX monomethyl ester cyclase
MRVLLAGPDHEENLSIRYLSGSLLTAGHDTVLAAFNAAVEIGAVANVAQDADLVGLSICFQARAKEFLALARQIKSRDRKKLVVAGGHYASCAAGALLANHPEIDVVVIHEGEKTLVEIADAMPSLGERLPEIAGIAFRSGDRVCFTKPRPRVDDLDTLPAPDRRGPVYMVAGVPTSYMMGSRGCFGNCAYCCITTLHRLAPGKRFRQRAVERVADEMAGLYWERGTRQFVFHDDNFLVPSEAWNLRRISGLEKALKQRGVENIALMIKCRPADANVRVLRRLKELGLVRVFLGVEAATARGLTVLDRNQSVDDSVRALDACADLDISAQFTLMTFNPDATLETLRDDVAFMRRYRGSPLNYCRAEIYAGTPLERRMVECGRAVGDYRAREYRLLDPVADLACRTALDLFHTRCWSGGSLMLTAIGLDHAAAVAKRFYPGPVGSGLARRVGDWVRAVNSDTIDLLEAVVELSASAGGRADERFRKRVREIGERESAARAKHGEQGTRLRLELSALRLADRAREGGRSGVSLPRLARQAAAALITVGLPAVALESKAIAQQGQTAPATPVQEKGECSITGGITDQSGAWIPKAKITITNTATGAISTAITNSAGEYIVKGLSPGRYTLMASALGFRVGERRGIVVREENCERVDVALRIDVTLVVEMGLSETVADRLTLEKWAQESLYEKQKPFNYVVGDRKDGGTFQGIAKLVYGDPKAWVQIFEANRGVMPKPGPIPYGTTIYIPPVKRVVPKLISKVTPAYPAAGKPGDVVLDVTLSNDGKVKDVEVIDGEPVLVEAALSAVTQWRYQPLVVKGKPIDQFVVVVSFGKNGTVR